MVAILEVIPVWKLGNSGDANSGPALLVSEANRVCSPHTRSSPCTWDEIGTVPRPQVDALVCPAKVLPAIKRGAEVDNHAKIPDRSACSWVGFVFRWL